MLEREESVSKLIRELYNTFIFVYPKLSIREGIKVEKKGGSEVTIALFILILKWPNSSRNAKKKFSPW